MKPRMMNKKNKIKIERQVNLMEKYFWVIYFVECHEVMLAETAEIAYAIMKEHIDSIDELNEPLVVGGTIKTVKDSCLEELDEDYQRVLASGAEDFGVMDVCHAELVPLYDHWGREE